AVNRGFQGGDIAGITKKIEEGYFSDLGITAIWMTPFFEQIHGQVDEGTGKTYGYHGYWAKDFTALDPNFGTKEDLEKLVIAARDNGIRIVMDVVVNHTGPVTELDPVWPAEWVRTSPTCSYKDYKSTITCTLVENLPDIRTESEAHTELPIQLLKKWEAEGRLEQELAELDKFFEETAYPRAPKYYIIKWLTDYIREYGISAYRLDTAKHTEESVWSVLRKEADRAYEQWKNENSEIAVKDDPFYMVGEVYGYSISNKREFSFGDTLVDFFANGIDHLINFEFKYDAEKDYETLFSKYSDILHNELEGKGVMNYLSSHDDGGPFDNMRNRPFEAATKLLLCPGAVQMYYGDETSRLLIAEGANGDANLRSFMNWDQLENGDAVSGYQIKDVLSHYQKLGQFRQKHPAVGAGVHEKIAEKPYIFRRTYEGNGVNDVVVVVLDNDRSNIAIPVDGIFEDGLSLLDSYSGKTVIVKNGLVEIETENEIVLLGIF
ncbi:MAG: alpha-amylase family glycosyl hydrolase, partial [Bacteroidales bacterium]|nr:alpha-amylase family glycosyl hydrolase [Bacteroidales bacterium]